MQIFLLKKEYKNKIVDSCRLQKLLYLCKSKNKHMTQIVVTLEKGADSSLLQRMIENMKGVLKATIRAKESKKENETISEETQEWIDRMRNLSNSINLSMIDMDDERTRYIMLK